MGKYTLEELEKRLLSPKIIHAEHSGPDDIPYLVPLCAKCKEPTYSEPVCPFCGVDLV